MGIYGYASFPWSIHKSPSLVLHTYLKSKQLNEMAFTLEEVAYYQSDVLEESFVEPNLKLFDLLI